MYSNVYIADTDGWKVPVNIMFGSATWNDCLFICHFLCMSNNEVIWKTSQKDRPEKKWVQILKYHCVNYTFVKMCHMLFKFKRWILPNRVYTGKLWKQYCLDKLLTQFHYSFSLLIQWLYSCPEADWQKYGCQTGPKTWSTIAHRSHIHIL